MYNYKTGKNDKRIFHSLGTKDEKQALEKQFSLDVQYDKKSLFNAFHSLLIKNNFYFKRILSLFIIFSGYFIFKGLDVKLKSNDIYLKAELESADFFLIENLEDDSLYFEEIYLNEFDIISSSDSLYLLPDFEIMRLDEFNSSFSQVNINIVVDLNLTQIEIKNICRKIKSDFLQYSNMVVCIYANTFVGRKVAKSRSSDYHINQMNDIWLAMYTYNDVEGDYFNSNPNDY